MVQLHTWIRLRGKKVSDGYWEIEPYPRVIDLLNLWQGPWIIDSRNPDRLLITIDFDGILYGNWRHIQSELETMDMGAYNMCMSWRLSASPKEIPIIQNILNNLAHPTHMSDVI